MATINTSDDRQLREALYRLVGYGASVVMRISEPGDAIYGTETVKGTIVDSQWRVRSRRGLHISVSGSAEYRTLPFDQIVSVSVER